jgi:superfamily II DNA or RNA helicase
VLTDLELDAFFDAGTLERARKVRRAQKIQKLDVSKDGSGITGIVRGSNGERYEVDVYLGWSGNALKDVEVVCDCPIKYNCKHGAALLLEADERGLLPKGKPLETGDDLRALMDTFKPPVEPPRPSSFNAAFSKTSSPTILSSEPRLEPRLDVWLKATARIAETDDQKTQTQTLAFTLSLTPAREIAFKVWSGKQRKDGSFAELKPYNMPSHLDSLPQYAMRDRPLLRSMMGLRVSLIDFATCVIGDFPLAPEFLKLLLETERCWWDAPNGPPLRLGETRAGELEWVTRRDGTQVPTFRVTPSCDHVLALTPPWFVDIGHAAIGLIETPFKPSLAKHFASCPPVAPGELLAFRSAFTARFPDLPAPVPILERVVDRACRPVLRLASRQVKSSWGSPVNLDIAMLEFEYGDGRFTPTDARPTDFRGASREVVSFKDGVLERTVRDPVAELNAERLLLALKLQPVPTYQIPGIGRAYTQPDAKADALETAWLRFMNKTRPALEELGWVIETDPSWRYRTVEASDWYGELEDSADTDGLAGAGGDGGWFGLELGVIVDGARLNLLPLLSELVARLPKDFTLDHLREMPDDARVYPRLPDGRLLALPVERVRALLGVLLELYSERPKGKLRLSIFDAARLLELQDALKLRWHGGERLLEMAKRLRDFRGIAQLAPPVGLRAELRPYQLEGFSWLQFLREHDLAGVLADDMGLGKTVQALAHILHEKSSGRLKEPALVVMPTSLVTNWKLEAARFAPDLKITVLHGVKRDHKSISGSDVVLTTYPLLLRDFDKLKKHQFHLIVLDEAQYIKNARSSTAQSASALKARHRICLTGTPLENHLGELWSIYNFLMPGFLGDEQAFRQAYRNPIEKNGDTDRRSQLARRIKPFLLRRAKHDVARELPPKTEILVPLELESSQRDLYETIRVAVSERIREEVEKKGLARSQIVVLDALLKLRQACCDPRLVKLEGAKPVKHNTKLDWFTENVPELLEEGRKLLVFSAFATLLGHLEQTLDGLKIPYAKLTGQTRDRAQQIEKFQSGDVSIFLISLKAGGVGLNLTAADTVIHYDPWWNPAAENQATDRAHRIGQTKPVFVYKLIAQGSLEEKILELQARKADLARGILEGGLTSAVALTQADLNNLLAPLSK